MTDMTKQTEADRLANHLDYHREYDLGVTHTGIDEQAAAELRRQQAEIERLNEALAEQPAPATELREQEPEYTWPTVAEYECDVGFKTNDAFRMGWDMARTTNKMLGITSPPAQRTWVGLTDEETGHWAADFLDGAKWAEAKLKEKNA